MAKAVLIVFSIVLLFITPVFAADYYGDLDNDGTVGIGDAILALKIIINRNPDLKGVTVASHPQIDVDQDGKIGTVEANYALQVESGYREQKAFPSGAAMFGSGVLSLFGFRRRIKAGLQRLTKSV